MRFFEISYVCLLSSTTPEHMQRHLWLGDGDECYKLVLSPHPNISEKKNENTLKREEKATEKCNEQWENNNKINAMFRIHRSKPRQNSRLKNAHLASRMFSLIRLTRTSLAIDFGLCNGLSLYQRFLPIIWLIIIWYVTHAYPNLCLSHSHSVAYAV